MMKARQTSEGNFKLIPVGMHRAIFTGLFDLGLQPGGQYDPAYKVAITWHTPDQLTEPTDGTPGRPMSITQVMTFSMHKKSNLRKMIENYYGKAFPSEEDARNFDLKHLLGRACLINVKHDTKGEKTYANVSTVSPLMSGMEKPTWTGELLYYYEEMPLHEKQEVYPKIPEWLRNKIDNQLNPKAATPSPKSAEAGQAGDDAAPDEMDDDIPF